LGIIIQQSVKNTIISYMGIALGFVTTILLFPRILTPDEYGLTRLMVSLAMISAQFCQMGMKKVIIRYFPYFDQMKGSRYNLLFLSIVVPLAGFLVFALAFILFQSTFIHYFKDQSALFSRYYFYLLPLLLSILFFEVLNNYIRALKDSVTGSFLNEVVIRAIMIVLLGCFYFGLIDYPAFIILFVLTYSVQPVYILFYLYSLGELSFSIPFLKDKRQFAKLISVYSIYSLLGGLSTMLVGNIDILMLSSMTNLKNTAVYFVAFAVTSVISVPQRSIIKIGFPVLANFLKNKKYAEIALLYQRTSIVQITFGSLIFVGIWANMHNLMDLLPAQYQGAKWVIITIGLAKLFDMSTGINGGIISNSKYYRFDLYVNIFLVGLSIVTNYLLIPIYGMLGAAIATAISIFSYNFIKFLFVWVKFSMQPFHWDALAILAIAVGCLLLSFQIPYMLNFFVDVIVRSGIITVLFLGLILIFNLSEDIKNLLTQSLLRVRTFFKR